MDAYGSSPGRQGHDETNDLIWHIVTHYVTICGEIWHTQLVCNWLDAIHGPCTLLPGAAQRSKTKGASTP